MKYPEYEPTITTDLSAVKKFDKSRILTVQEQNRKNKKKNKTYPKGAFNPKDKNNYKF